MAEIYFVRWQKKPNLAKCVAVTIPQFALPQPHPPIRFLRRKFRRTDGGGGGTINLFRMTKVASIPDRSVVRVRPIDRSIAIVGSNEKKVVS